MKTTREGGPLIIDAEALELVEPVNPRNMTVSQAVERYLDLRSLEGEVRRGTDHYRHYDKQLRRSFCGVLGKLPLAQVTPDHIRTWMSGLRSLRSGAPLVPLTQRHYLKAVITLMRRAVDEHWIDHSPCDPVVAPHVPDRDVNVISPGDAFTCFKANVNQPAVARLALEAFGGLRFSTAARIGKDQIKMERHGIEMPASIHKTRKRVYRQGQPANLWEWLREATDETWGMEWRAYRETKMLMHYNAGLRKELNRYQCMDAAERDRLKALRNVWRHSFATYLLAAEKSFGRTSYLMQHTSAKTTTIYEGVADEDDAKLYFAITPDAVRTMTWDEFRRSVIQPKHILEPESAARVPATMPTSLQRWEAKPTASYDYRAE